MINMFGDEFENYDPLFLHNFLLCDEIFQNQGPLFENNIQDNLIINNSCPILEINDKNDNKEESSEDSKKTSKDSKKDILFLTKKVNKTSKKGRKTKRDNNIGEKCHDKNSYDNILRKIQVKFISFIRDYANAILQQTFYNVKFLKINYKFKKTVNKSSIKVIKNSTIGNILCKKISEKYKNINKEKNKEIFEMYIETNPELKQIFSETYINLFKNIYFLGKRQISLKINGENITISLNGIKMFDDFLNQIGKEEKKNIEYINRIKKCVQDNFFN